MALITANEARNISQTEGEKYIKKKIQKQIDYVNERIVAAAVKGDYEILLYLADIALYDETIEEMIKFGYEVKKHDYVTSISWTNYNSIEQEPNVEYEKEKDEDEV